MMRSMRLSFVLLLLAFCFLSVLAGEECAVYRKGSHSSFPRYEVASYEYCSGGCCGDPPNTHCCSQTVVIVGGSVGGGVGLTVIIIFIRCYYFG